MKRLIPALLVFLLMMTGFALADSAGYTITDYYTEVIVHEDNTAEVTETITCNFTEPRHGIVRDIPLTFTVGKRIAGDSESGSNRYTTKLSDLWVAGADGSYTEEDGVCSIRLGDEDRTVQGEVTYQIGYTQSFPWDRMDSTDFFFFSVLGSGWDVPVENFSFSVTFPKAVDTSAVKLFSGADGEENLLNVQYEVTDTAVSGFVDDAGTGNAVTVFAKLPEGYFDQEKPSTAVPYAFTVLAAAAALLTILLALIAKRRRPQAVETAMPPEGLSPAEVGTIIDGSADDNDLLSLLPYWANLGYISMNEENGHLKLTKNSPLPESAPEYQQLMFTALFGSEGSVYADMLGPRFFTGFDKAKAKLSAVFTGERALYKGSVASFGLPVLCCVLMMLALGTCAMNDIIGDTMVAGCILIPGIISRTLGARLNRGFFSKRSALSAVGTVLCVGLAALCVLGSMLVAEIFTAESLIPAAPLDIAAALCAAACFMAYRIKVPTDYNLETASRLLGLRDTIQAYGSGKSTAAPDDSSAYFYTLLPYAMVFGLAEEWNEWMTRQMLPPPGWYYADDVFTVIYFDHMMDRSFRKPISNYRSEHSGSSGGSSSGGFSGGGGGGGGGHSW